MLSPGENLTIRQAWALPLGPEQLTHLSLFTDMKSRARPVTGFHHLFHLGVQSSHKSGVVADKRLKQEDSSLSNTLRQQIPWVGTKVRSRILMEHIQRFNH